MAQNNNNGWEWGSDDFAPQDLSNPQSSAPVPPESEDTAASPAASTGKDPLNPAEPGKQRQEASGLNDQAASAAPAPAPGPSNQGANVASSDSSSARIPNGVPRASGYGPASGPRPQGAARQGYGWQDFKPGIIPLRPLRLSDVFDGAFAALRANPAVMFGTAFVIMLIAEVVQQLTSFVTGFNSAILEMVRFIDSAGSEPDFETLAPYLAPLVSRGLIVLGASILGGIIFINILSGMLTHAVSTSVIGHISSAGDSLRVALDRLVPIILVSFLTSLIGIATTLPVIVLFILFAVTQESTLLAIAFISLLMWVPISIYLSTRFSFGTIVTVLEELGPVKSVKRSWQLTRGSFWRIFGRTFLMGLITTVIAGIIGQFTTLIVDAVGGNSGAQVPELGAFLPTETISFGLILTILFAALTQALVQPLLAATVTLCYTDERIRKENFDAVLISAAQS